MARSASASDAATDAASPVLVPETGPEDGGATGGAGAGAAPPLLPGVATEVLVPGGSTGVARGPSPESQPVATRATRITAAEATEKGQRTAPRYGFTGKS